MTRPRLLTALRQYTRAWELTTLAPAPVDAVRHGKDSDIEGGLPVLWALVQLLRPRRVLELGTRQALSTRTLALALDAVGEGGELLTVDPDPTCQPYVNGLPRTTFVCMTGEQAFTYLPALRPELLFIDTDPHTLEQTTRWLQTWVSRVPSNGCIVFHDVYPARPEIQVTEAVEAFLTPGWVWHTFPVDEWGLGVLWTP